MANYQYANPQMIMQSQYQQIQSMFPQPQGSVYSINSPLEIGNVPIGSTGLSVVLCLNEDVMYIKSFQNGAPVIMAYNVTPYQKDVAAAVNINNLAFSTIIQVRPTCCAVMNATNISVVNTGIASTVTNANIVITKIA